ncbi:photosynthetic reaction center cytochrome PufC [Tranquillimonas alkanivorans]|uniref:Photosynthetic reaction center cytochrome c subunit n=1 Tax=Tranquillimonas alkanivorans TaxID=441119 RepID=A0A1I5MYC7_9RHOB|nr:photosynthetic reaction center cytochrome PufC [Tranquillimonas alkanivorans]SFP14548.1 photosynthetic reaction center cytochrome c subunit [Tranquillimonas alkanivorans]
MKRDPQGRRLFLFLVVVTGFGGLFAVLALPKWDRPPIQSTEWGPPAIAMDTFVALNREPDPLNTRDFPVPEPVEDAGVPASAVYDDVEVLGDLDRAQFDRLQVAITAWVAPDEGCSYCHAEGQDGALDHAAEQPYTFEVARQMLRMVREINAEDAGGHLAPQGVTCFTCHRGENIPAYTWLKAGDWPPPEDRWFQKPPPWIRTATTIREFFPREAFELFILEDNRAAGIQTRAIGPGDGVTVLPRNEPEPDGMPLFTRAENIYLFMMQMSDAMGVNCTFCHNSRVFYDWNQSTPHRVTAWYAIDQTQKINHDHIEPLKDRLPPFRLGPVGDPYKVNCMTCHVSKRKPLDGIPMVEFFPGLVAPG